MKNAKLKEQFTNIIEFHYERELWHSRPEQSYAECIESFVDDLIRVATCYKRGWQFHSHQYDKADLFSPSITGEKIGEEIRDLRLRRGWSLARLAKMADIDTTYLQNIERGEPILRIWALERILDSLKVKSSEILPF